MLTQVLDFFAGLFGYILQTFQAHGLLLGLSILIAVLISVYIDVDRTKAFFVKGQKYLILGSVLLGAFTPLCACGTMAVVLSLYASTMPWGTVMAFLVSSPLMSPDTYVLLSIFMGVEFATVLATASVVLGLGAGWITSAIARHTSFLNGQFKVLPEKKLGGIRNASGAENLSMVGLDKSASACCATSCCSSSAAQGSIGKDSIAVSVDLENGADGIMRRLKVNELLSALYSIAIVKIIPLFILFVGLAYAVRELVPTSWIVNLFSGEHFYSVPLAALIGLPMYVSDATILPLLEVLKNAGASSGALLAFMIAGPATSIGVIGGLGVMLKRKAIVLYVAIIIIGSLFMGYLYDLILLML